MVEARRMPVIDGRLSLIPEGAASTDRWVDNEELAPDHAEYSFRNNEDDTVDFIPESSGNIDQSQALIVVPADNLNCVSATSSEMVIRPPTAEQRIIPHIPGPPHDLVDSFSSPIKALLHSQVQGKKPVEEKKKLIEEKIDDEGHNLQQRLAKLKLKGKDFIPADKNCDKAPLLPNSVSKPLARLSVSVSSVVADVNDSVDDLLEGLLDSVQMVSEWIEVIAVTTGLSKAAQLGEDWVNNTGNLSQNRLLKKKGDEEEEKDLESLISGCLPLYSMLKAQVTTKPPVVVDWKKEGVVGCEITFTLTVTPEQRLLLGVPSWEATDVPVLLAKQMLELDSPLRSGGYTRHIVDVRFKNTHTRRKFSQWENFWVHSLHPVFFGRSSTVMENDIIDYRLSSPPSSPNRFGPQYSPNRLKTSLRGMEEVEDKSPEARYFQRDEGHLSNTHRKVALPSADIQRKLKLIHGMKYDTPVSKFSVRSIRAFLTLPSELARPGKELEDKWTIVGGALIPPTAKTRLELKDYKLMMAGTFNQLVDFKNNKPEEDSEDETLDDQESLERMGLIKALPDTLHFDIDTISPEIVELLLLQFLAMQTQLDTAMRGGLVDGVRMHVEQFDAMKERDKAKRLYSAAKQMLNLKERRNGQLPVDFSSTQVQLTEVTTEHYERWLREMRREELRMLKVRQKAVAMMKSLRKQETDIKERFGALRVWLINSMISNYPHSEPSKSELLATLNAGMRARKIDAVTLKDMPEMSAAALAVERQRQKVLMSMESLSETKRTRQLLEAALRWVQRVKKLCREPKDLRDGKKTDTPDKSKDSNKDPNKDSNDKEVGQCSPGLAPSRGKNSKGLLKGKSTKQRKNEYSSYKLMQAMANRGKGNQVSLAADTFLQNACKISTPFNLSDSIDKTNQRASFDRSQFSFNRGSYH